MSGAAGSEKEWNAKVTSEEALWHYNCLDCINTRHVGEATLRTAKTMGLEGVHAAQQQMFWPVLQAMIRGVWVIPEERTRLAGEIQEQISLRENFLREVLGHPININSPKQMIELFYTDLGQPVIKSRPKKGTPSHVTCDDEALQKIAAREPILAPIVSAIADIRTLGIFLGNFVLAKLDLDGRMRCSYNIGGSESGKSAPKTYRLSSSKNAFDCGTNLQNIPSEKSKSVGKAAARGNIALIGDPYALPNVRALFGPDPGFTFFDMDLDRADLQVVVWETNDRDLKHALGAGADIHLLNAYVLDGRDPPALDELVEGHPRYEDHKGPMKHKREFAKVFCHACITSDHEVLTPNGWIRIDQVGPSEEIAVWNKTNSVINFEQPSSWYHGLAGGSEDSLIEFEGQAYSQKVTANHRMPYTVDKTGYRVAKALDVAFKNSARLPKSGFYSGRIKTGCARLIAAFVADGSIDSYGNAYFHFHKQRKKERLRKLLEGYTYSEYPDRFYVPRRSCKVFTDQGKKFGPWLLTLHGEDLDEIIDESKYWDGTQGATGAITVSSVDKEHLEWLRTIIHLRGKASQYQGSNVSSFGSVVHRISINNRPLAAIANMTKYKVIAAPEAVHCPTTSTGFFMVRRNGKISVTGNTNYVGSARTIAGHVGRSVHEVDRAQRIWFGAHPGIKRWHEDVLAQITKRRFVENKFGYRWFIFDRIEAILPEAVAWLPQSTVSIVINRIWQNLYQNAPEVSVLLQVHDSLAGQFPTHRHEASIAALKENARVVIPYDDPLIIPVGISTSTESWGACK